MEFRDALKFYNDNVEWDMHWSNMHIVIEDGNMEDDHIKWCVDQGVNEKEKKVCDFLLSIPVEARYDIWEVSSA